MAFTGKLGTVLTKLGNIQLGKGDTAASLPNTPPASPTQGGFIPILAYRVLDPFGKELIKYLPHLHQSKWEVRGMMPGQAGASIVGKFEIPLHVPGSVEWREAAVEYSKLDVGCRVEGYLGDIISGNPRVTGIIREKPADFNKFTIRGVDSIWALQSKSTMRQENFSGRTDTLFLYGLKGYTSQVLEDFTNFNMMADPSFEDANLTNLQTFWQIGTSSEASIDSSAGNFKTGLQSLKITTTRVATGWNAINPASITAISVSPLKSYQFGVWVKQTAGAKQTHFKILWYKNDGVSLSSIRATDFIQGGTDGVLPWTFWSNSTGIIPPADAAYAYPQLMTGWWDGVTGTNAQFWWDDAQMFVSDGTAFNTYVNGAWVPNKSNPNGDAALTTEALSAFDGLMYTTANLATSAYADIYSDAWFFMQCQNVAGMTAEAGLLMAVGGTGDMIMGRANMRQATVAGNNTRFEIDAEIWQKLGGTWTRKQRIPNVVVTPSPSSLVKVSLRGIQNGAGYTWEVQLNGAPSGCVWAYNNTPYGAVGIRSLVSASPNTGGNTSGSVVYATNWIVAAKQNLFTPGNVSAGTKFINQTLSNTPLLDLITMASTIEGYSWRKNCLPGTDSIDFGPSIGADLSNKIVFAEGRNMDAQSSIEPNLDPVITAGRLVGSPGQDNVGFLEWVNIPAAKKYGLVYDTMAAANVSDFGSQQALLKKLVSLRSTPGQSKNLYVLRDPDTVDLWRELDFVGVTSGRLGLGTGSPAKVQVMGWTLDEGQPKQNLIGDQFPAGMMVADLRRLRSTIDQLAAGIDDVTPTSASGSGVVYDSRYGSPSILTFTGGYQSVTTTQNYRLKFQIPNNFAVIQKILLTMTLTSAAVGSGNTGAGTSHAHTVGSTSAESGHSHSHTHSIHITTGAGAASLATTAAGGALFGNNGGTPYDTGQVVNADATGSSGHTHTNPNTGGEALHTHAIAGGSSSWAQSCLLSYGPIGSSFPQGSTTSSFTLTGFGPYTTGASGPDKDITNIDLTQAIAGNATNPIGGGSWELDVQSTATGGIIATIIIIGLVKSL